MLFTGLDHVGFSVSDMDVSVAWYTEFLGEDPSVRKTWEVEYVSRIVGYPDCKMECAFWRLPGGTILELLKYIEPPTGKVDMESYNAGNGHLCLLTEDLQADFDRLRGKVEFRDPEPVDIPWGPYTGGRACYLRDPDGISIELMQPPPGGPKI
jgi:catechol 2,3-dioxygenase-like lactoylglutathione lyase family enzyme